MVSTSLLYSVGGRSANDVSGEEFVLEDYFGMNR